MEIHIPRFYNASVGDYLCLETHKISSAAVTVITLTVECALCHSILNTRVIGALFTPLCPPFRRALWLCSGSFLSWW